MIKRLKTFIFGSIAHIKKTTIDQIIKLKKLKTSGFSLFGCLRKLFFGVIKIPFELLFFIDDIRYYIMHSFFIYIIVPLFSIIFAFLGIL